MEGTTGNAFDPTGHEGMGTRPAAMPEGGHEIPHGWK